MSSKDEFYIGYLEQAPSATARLMKTVTIALALFGMFTAGFLISQLRPFDQATYEFGNIQDITGVILETPVPSVLVERPAAAGRMPGFSRYLLAAQGKFGAHQAVSGLHGQVATLNGELIYRYGETMFKLQADGVTPLDNHNHQLKAQAWVTLATQGQSAGQQTLSGEIVDSQCFLGIMKPGYGKTHRACAVRCLSGGLPPLLYALNAQGQANYYLVLGKQGENITPELLPYIADVLQLDGEVIRYPQLNVIHTDISQIRRL